MKRIFALVLVVCLLAGCSQKETDLPEAAPSVPEPQSVETQPTQPVPLQADEAAQIPYNTRFDAVTEITLSDDGISVDGAGETETVFTSHDIVY